jgi:general secretion pathway protein J
MTTPRDPAAGVTLVEMLVALALLAIIGLAGVSVLDQVLRAQDRTADRLDRLGQMQRAMHVVTLDFITAVPGSVEPRADGVAVGRQADIGIDYRLQDGTLWRRVATPGGEVARQALLTAVDTAEWRYLAPGGGWSDSWPPADAPARLGAAPTPRAVELRLTLQDGGALRRLAMLPAGPP